MEESMINFTGLVWLNNYQPLDLEKALPLNQLRAFVKIYGDVCPH